MKYGRILIGLIIIFVGLWVIVGEQISRASANAFVNAQVVTVRTERAGTLELPWKEPGALIARGEPVASVSNPMTDLTRVHDLSMEIRFKSAEIAARESLIAQLSDLLSHMEARTETYNVQRMKEITARLDHARTRLAILESERPPLAAAQELADAADDRADRVPGAPLLTELAIEHARERVSVLETALTAAESGVFIGDGYNDAPFSEQRTVDLLQSLALERTALMEARAELGAIEKREAQERQQVNRQSEGRLVSPVDGLFWEALATDGISVQRGDPVLSVVDCGSVIVSLSVTEMVYNRLSLGQEATFRFTDEGQTYSGTVTRLAGAGANRIYNEMAVAPSQKHLERWDVTLTIPALREDIDNYCAIGRTGRVFFDTRPLDGLRQLFR